MTSRDHMPGYAPALDDEALRAMPRQPYPLGVPHRVKVECGKRVRAATTRLLRDVLPRYDPLQATCMTISDVPGVLLAGGPNAVEDALDRVVAKGVDARGMVAALRGRAVQEDRRDIVDRVDEWVRYRARENLASIQQQAEPERQRLYHSTTLHPQAGQVMQGFITAEQVRAADRKREIDARPPAHLQGIAEAAWTHPVKR